jgi:tetratricopeptide (TPR) repeat protein
VRGHQMTERVPQSAMDAPPALYGRTRELERWARAVRHAARSGAVVAGVSGVGKSGFAAYASNQYAVRHSTGTIRIDCALHSDERSLMAELLARLHDVAQIKREDVSANVRSKIKALVPEVRALVWAFSRDVFKRHFGDLEHTTEALQDLLGDDSLDKKSDLTELIERARRENLRQALVSCLDVVRDAGAEVVLVIDNCERVDVTVGQGLRVVLDHWPEHWPFLACVNTEGADGRRVVETTLQPVQLKGAARIELPPLDRSRIESWVTAARGEAPSIAELDRIEASTGGRPYFLNRYLRGEEPDEIGGDYTRVVGAYARGALDELSADATGAARLLSILPDNSAVDTRFFVPVAEVFGLTDVSSAIEELKRCRLIRMEASMIGFDHALTAREVRGSIIAGDARFHVAWKRAMVGFTENELLGIGGRAWIEAEVHAGRLPLLPQGPRHAIDRLVNSGQLELADALIERAREVAMREHPDDAAAMTLSRARIRYEQGRYRDAEEELAVFGALSASSTLQQREDAAVLELRLLLRLNRYQRLFEQGSRLRGQGLSPPSLVTIRLIENTAWRDLNETDEIAATAAVLAEIGTDPANFDLVSRVGRAVARSYAKLGKLAEGWEQAVAARAAAERSNSSTAVANACLALAEVERANGNYGAAKADYIDARDRARNVGSRDTELWARLGIADVHRLEGNAKEFEAELATLQSMVREAGFVHPLEQCHVELLRIAGRAEATGTAEHAVNQLVTRYRDLGVHWLQRKTPREWLREWQREPLPF